MKYAFYVCALALLVLSVSVFAVSPTPIVISSSGGGDRIVYDQNAGTAVITLNNSLSYNDIQPFFMSVQQNFQRFYQEQRNQSVELAQLRASYAQLDDAYGALQRDWHDYIELRWNSMFIFFFAVAILIIVLTPLYAAILFNRIQEHFLSQFVKNEIKAKPQPPKAKRKWFGLRKGE